MANKEFEKHEDKIREFALRVGYPEDALDLFCSVVYWEWERKIFMKAYATLIDWSSPDYQEAIKKHNTNLITLRKKLASTEVGRKSISKIPPELNDGRSTIVYPALPEEFSDQDAFYNKRRKLA